MSRNSILDCDAREICVNKPAVLVCISGVGVLGGLWIALICKESREPGVADPEKGVIGQEALELVWEIIMAM